MESSFEGQEDNRLMSERGFGGIYLIIRKLILLHPVNRFNLPKSLFRQLFRYVLNVQVSDTTQAS